MEDLTRWKPNIKHQRHLKGETMSITPKEIRELRKVYEPYIDMVSLKLREDAPAEAVEAYEKCRKWHREVDTDL